MEDKLIEYLDGRAKPADRRTVEEHLRGCADCRLRAEEFLTLWGALDDLPVVPPSPVFDALLHARIAAEPAPRNFWGWVPSLRLSFALTALVVLSAWMSSMPQLARNQTAMSRPSSEADFRMIQDLPVLENYDVLSKFDVLSEVPVSSVADSAGVTEKENR